VEVEEVDSEVVESGINVVVSFSLSSGRSVLRLCQQGGV
jgi:hypothetical protein